VQTQRAKRTGKVEKDNGVCNSRNQQSLKEIMIKWAPDVNRRGTGEQRLWIRKSEKYVNGPRQNTELLDARGYGDQGEQRDFNQCRFRAASIRAGEGNVHKRTLQRKGKKGNLPALLDALKKQVKKGADRRTQERISSDSAKGKEGYVRIYCHRYSHIGLNGCRTVVYRRTRSVEDRRRNY